MITDYLANQTDTFRFELSYFWVATFLRGSKMEIDVDLNLRRFVADNSCGFEHT